MEGRLILSGDAPEFVSWDAHSPGLGLAIYKLSAMPPQLVPVEYIDGGFINSGGVSTESTVYGTFDSVTIRADFGAFGPALPPTGSVSLSGSGDIDVEFGDVYLDTPEIPVIVFPGADSDVDTTFVDQPADAGPQPAEVTADEGGAIPINSILAFVGHTESWKSSERVASLATAQRGDAHWQIPSTSQLTHSREIAGEWARPTMLEMAGGEPVSMREPESSRDERTPASDDGELRFRRPLSSGAAADAPAKDSQAAHGMDRPRGSAGAIPTEEPASANRRASAASQQPHSLVLAIDVADADSQHRSALPATAEASQPENHAASRESVMNDSAYAEVYDRLGTSESRSAQAIFNQDSWRDSWKATPLLMILALERIAASNSRRAQREASGSAARPKSHAVSV
jgi:hypothetical protein